MGEFTIPNVSAAGNINELKSLLDEGWDPNAPDERGRRGVHWACSRGRASVLRLLLDHGAEVNCVDCHGNTPLHYAGHVETISCLLEHGAQISRNHNGDTPDLLMRRRGVEPRAIELLERLEPGTAGQQQETDLLLDPQPPVQGSRTSLLKSIQDDWYRFCKDLGAERLVCLILVILVISVYVAYMATSIAKQVDSRIPVDGGEIRVEL